MRNCCGPFHRHIGSSLHTSPSLAGTVPVLGAVAPASEYKQCLQKLWMRDGAELGMRGELVKRLRRIAIISQSLDERSIVSSCKVASPRDPATFIGTSSAFMRSTNACWRSASCCSN